jgi:hypothetical protein
VAEYWGQFATRCLSVVLAQEDPMTRPIFSASTLPVELPPDRLLLFIQQAQLTLLYSECS